MSHANLCSESEWKSKLANMNSKYSCLDRYNGSKNKIRFLCNVHGEFYCSPSNFLRGRGCPKCGHKNKILARTLTFNHLVELANKNNGYILDTKYVTSRYRYLWKCINNHEWRASHFSIKRGTWCRKCAAIKNGKNKTLDIQIVSRLARRRGGKLLSDVYVNARTNLKWQCKLGHIWTAKYDNVKKTWCPMCAASRGERLIAEYLGANLIEYFRQHKFDNCRNKRRLSFDFYLPHYNMCIEYDGEHHFFNSFKNDKSFKLIAKNDVIKNQYCKDNDIRLLRIPYWNINQIDSIVHKAIFSNFTTI